MKEYVIDEQVESAKTLDIEFSQRLRVTGPGGMRTAYPVGPCLVRVRTISYQEVHRAFVLYRDREISTLMESQKRMVQRMATT